MKGAGLTQMDMPLVHGVQGSHKRTCPLAQGVVAHTRGFTLCTRGEGLTQMKLPPSTRGAGLTQKTCSPTRVIHPRFISDCNDSSLITSHSRMIRLRSPRSCSPQPRRSQDAMASLRKSQLMWCAWWTRTTSCMVRTRRLLQ